MSNGGNEGKTLKTLAIIILVITAITLVYLFIHDQNTRETGDSADVSQVSEEASAAATAEVISIVQAAAAGDINTFAGGGSILGDGGAATNAKLRAPFGVEADSSGNVFIADSYQNRIRMVDANGIITTVAGNGGGGFSGDGGPATSASMYTPADVALDSAGNLYIADRNNQRIRMVDTNGIITTVAGKGNGPGTGGYSGDGGPAINASLREPMGVAVDSSGNLYIGDVGNHRIRKVDTNGIITTVAGSGTQGFCGDGGPATSACLMYPVGVTLDSAGNLYIAGNNNNRIRKVDINGIITTVAGSGTRGYCGDGGQATSACLRNPRAVKVDNAGNLYIADDTNRRVRKVDTSGIITTVAGSGIGWYCDGDGGPATSACINPYGVALDSAGNLYIADVWNNRIRIVEHGECGNNIPEVHESCDDGNTTSGDGCSSQCLREYEQITGDACVDAGCPVLNGCYQDVSGFYNHGEYLSCITEKVKECGLTNTRGQTVTEAAQSYVNMPENNCGM